MEAAVAAASATAAATAGAGSRRAKTLSGGQTEKVLPMAHAVNMKLSHRLGWVGVLGNDLIDRRHLSLGER